MVSAHARWGKRDCALYLRNLEIAQCSAQSRDYASIVRNLEIRTQSRDSENAQRNLEIAQILRLRGTYISVFSQCFDPLLTVFGNILFLSCLAGKAQAGSFTFLWHRIRRTQ